MLPLRGQRSGDSRERGGRPLISKFAFPTSIVFGEGASRQVGGHLVEAGYTRPLVVTDRGIAALPVFARFVAGLAGVDHAVYSGISGNPTTSAETG